MIKEQGTLLSLLEHDVDDDDVFQQAKQFISKHIKNNFIPKLQNLAKAVVNMSSFNDVAVFY
jgi:hypothetical protein